MLNNFSQEQSKARLAPDAGDVANAYGNLAKSIEVLLALNGSAVSGLIVSSQAKENPRLFHGLNERGDYTERLLEMRAIAWKAQDEFLAVGEDLEGLLDWSGEFPNAFGILRDRFSATYQLSELHINATDNALDTAVEIGFLEESRRSGDPDWDFRIQFRDEYLPEWRRTFRRVLDQTEKLRSLLTDNGLGLDADQNSKQ